VEAESLPLRADPSPLAAPSPEVDAASFRYAAGPMAHRTRKKVDER
jgi:hypothetical protein